MGDITYEDLIKAKGANEPAGGEMDIMAMANIALKILEQVNNIRGRNGNKVINSQPIMQSRTEEMQTMSQTSEKSNFNIETILKTLTTVRQLKGDIKLSELEKLIDENKEQVEGLLAKV